MDMVDDDGVPYANHRQHLHLKPRSYDHPKTGERVVSPKGQVMVTVRGLEYLRRRLLEEKRP